MEARSERKRTIELLEAIPDRIAVDYQKGPLQKNPKTDNGMVLPFSISYEHLKPNPRPVDMLVYVFAQEAKVGYHSEMQSNKYKSDALNHDRKNITAKFGRVKKIVKLMLMNIGAYPDNKPMDPKQLAAGKKID